MNCPYCQSTLPNTAETCVICGCSLPQQEQPTITPPLPVVSPPLPSPPSLSSIPPLPAASSLPAGQPTLDDQLAAIASFQLDEENLDEFDALLNSTLQQIKDEEAATSTAIIDNLPADSIEQMEATEGEDGAEQETDLIGLVTGYTIIGGYSAAVVGLFTPGLLTLVYCLTLPEFGAKLVGFFVFFILGAILWIPLSVIVAVVVGIGGLLLGIGVGLIAAILFRLTFHNPQALRASRILVAMLNAAVFGYAASWAYSNSILGELFYEMTLIPYVLGLVGAIAGLVLALFGPEKSQDTTELTDEETTEAVGLLLAPFRFWSSAAGRTGAASIATMVVLKDQADAEASIRDRWRYDREMQAYDRAMREATELQKKQFDGKIRSLSEQESLHKTVQRKYDEAARHMARINKNNHRGF